MEVTFYRCFLGRSLFQFLDIFHKRLLHARKRVAQLANLINALEVGQLGFELSRGNRLGLLGQAPQGIELACNDADEKVEHQQQTYDDDGHDGLAQTVEATEDILLRAYDGHRATRLTEGFVEHVTVLSVNNHMLHAFLPALHGMS